MFSVWEWIDEDLAHTGSRIDFSDIRFIMVSVSSTNASCFLGPGGFLNVLSSLTWGYCSQFPGLIHLRYLSLFSFSLFLSNCSITYLFLNVFHMYLIQFISTAIITVQVVTVSFLFCCYNLLL